jgi:hypothetical protein
LIRTVQMPLALGLPALSIVAFAWAFVLTFVRGFLSRGGN